MTIGANNSSGERLQTLLQRGMVPQSNNIKEGYAVVHVLVSGDNLAVDVPTSALAFNAGRAFAGINQSAGTVNVTYDNEITVAKEGIAKAVLKANTACTAGTEAGYDPADGGPFQPVTPANAGYVVPVGRFTQSKTSSASEQFVGIELYAHGTGMGATILGSIASSSTAVSNTTTETAFDRSIAIPAGRLNVEQLRLRIHAKVRITGGNANDTLQVKLRLDSAAGSFIGQTPAVDVTNAGGDIATLDCEVCVRTAGATGSLLTSGLAGISPGQAVATGGNVQTTGTTLSNIDLTAAHTLVTTATWSGASASNSCYLEDFAAVVLG